MDSKPKMKTWIWIVIIVVVLAIIGFVFWYTARSDKVVVTSSPTPTKTATISPSAKTSASPTTSPSPSPTPTPTPAVSPTPVAPTGWKYYNPTIYKEGSGNVVFSIFAKSNWQEFNKSETTRGPIFYTSNTECQAGQVSNNYPKCWGGIIVSLVDISSSTNLVVKNYSISSTKAGDIWVGINKTVESGDQTIIFDSFKVTADNR